MSNDTQRKRRTRTERFFKGDPEERIAAYLESPDGSEPTPNPFHCDYSSPLFPFITLVSTSAPKSKSDKTKFPTVTFRYAVQKQHCNRLGALHGGCAATLFDLLTTLALSLIARPGFWYHMGVSRTLNVTYLRPAKMGEGVLIECEVVQAGARVCTLRGTMRRERDGEVLAVCEHGKMNIDPPVASKL